MLRHSVLAAAGQKKGGFPFFGQARRSCLSSLAEASQCAPLQFQEFLLPQSSLARFPQTRQYRTAFSFFTNHQSPSTNSFFAMRKSFAAAG
jgi:hypothetical protein